MEISRRIFLKNTGTILVGVAAGAIMAPQDAKINDIVTDLTSHPTGNASVLEKSPSCKNDPNPRACYQNLPRSTNFFDRIINVAVTPCVEEIAYRYFPSQLVSNYEGRIDPVRDARFGTGGFGLSKIEIISGILVSTLFGLAHNITESGINTRLIPASQTFDGLVYWYLQRKLGLMSNLACHAEHNLLT